MTLFFANFAARTLFTRLFSTQTLEVPLAINNSTNQFILQEKAGLIPYYFSLYFQKPVIKVKTPSSSSDESLTIPELSLHERLQYKPGSVPTLTEFCTTSLFLLIILYCTQLERTFPLAETDSKQNKKDRKQSDELKIPLLSASFLPLIYWSNILTTIHSISRRLFFNTHCRLPALLTQQPPPRDFVYSLLPPVSSATPNSSLSPMSAFAFITDPHTFLCPPRLPLNTTAASISRFFGKWNVTSLTRLGSINAQPSSGLAYGVTFPSLQPSALHIDTSSPLSPQLLPIATQFLTLLFILLALSFGHVACVGLSPSAISSRVPQSVKQSAAASAFAAAVWSGFLLAVWETAQRILSL